jgi:hypothetical protein
VRFVLLSMLLHATIVILFGTSHGGPGRGEGVLDVLDVTLRRQPSLPDAGLRSGPGAETATGRALLQRADPQPPAVAPGRSEPMLATEPAKTSGPTPVEPAAPAPQPSQTQPETVPPMPQQAAEPLPRIDLRAPQEVDKPLVPLPIAPPAIERLAPPPNPPALAAPLDIAPRAIPLVPAAPIERLAAPALQHELAPPIELAPAPAAAPSERLAVPAAPKALAPPVELSPREAPIVPAPLDRLAVPRIDQELAPSPNLVAPSPSAPLAAPSDAVPSQAERAASPASARPPPVPATSEVAAPAPATAAEPPRLRLGTPPAGAGEDIFKPRRDIAAPEGEPGGTRIDLEAARKRAREIASEATSTRGILPALPPPPEKKSKESIALEKAIKPDCRTAYAGMGLLAVPALVASSIGDGGCRW